MRIVLFDGDFRYGVVNAFTSELSKALAARGVTTSVIDIRRPHEEVAQDLSDVCDADDVIALFGFNALGSTIKVDGAPLHEALGVPFISYLVDHPIFHAEALTRLANQPVLCVDNAHVRFLEGFGMPQAHYAPHAGATPGTFYGAPAWKSRPERMLFAGSFEPLDSLRARLAAVITDDLAAVDAAIQPLSEAFEALADEGPFHDDDSLIAHASTHPLTFEVQQFMGISAHFTTLLRCLILWHRNRNRHVMIKALDDLGCPVDIHGEGWESAGLRNHRIKGPLPFAQLVEAIPNYRFVLNQSPLFGDGLHDRIVHGALSGSVVCTERNPQTAALIDNGAAVGHSSGNAAEIAEAVTRLDGTDEGAAIAAKGRQMATFEHTWAARAAKIMSVLGR